MNHLSHDRLASLVKQPHTRLVLELNEGLLTTATNVSADALLA